MELWMVRWTDDRCLCRLTLLSETRDVNGRRSFVPAIGGLPDKIDSGTIIVDRITIAFIPLTRPTLIPVRVSGPPAVGELFGSRASSTSARARCGGGRTARVGGSREDGILDRSGCLNMIIFGPGVRGTVYGIRTVQWRVALALRWRPFTSMRDSMVRGSGCAGPRRT